MVLFKKIWSILISILLVSAVLLVATFALPYAFGLRPFVITSGSMEPLYPVGSLIYVKQVSPEEIAIGDSITFSMANSSIVATHQVYEIDEDKKLFRTQGINNCDENGEILRDPDPVYYDSLIGKPVLSVPYLGRLNLFCTTSPGCFVVIGVAFALAAISFVVDRIPVSDPGTKKQCTENPEN